MALTKTLKPSKTTSSIIKTRAQARTEARTGTNVRTNDDTIAPAPAPVAVATGRTTGRTTDSDVAPAPVVHTTDLFANRPKTGALKDPPVPRDRDSHRDSDDDAKKPAAKPKGRRPKATTRKPRKPRTDPADDLVDPMANIHVGDAISGRVVTAGGLARAGGNDPVLADPVLANPEQLEPEQLDEPQPKKKTRRAVD